MKRTLKFSPLITLFVVAAILVSRPPVRGQILQYPLCSKGCVTSYRSYTAWNGTTIPTDNTRQGINPYETQLRASTLVQNNFKFQGSVQVDGQIYAQPLYMSGLKSSFVASEQAVFVATEHGSVYAINGTALQVVTMKSLLPSGDTSVPQGDLPIDTSTNKPCDNITYEVGITGTPVIDPTTPEPNGDPVLFAVVKSKRSDGTYHQTLHAWDPLTNTELQTTTFDIGTALLWDGTNNYALLQNQRAGLALTHDSNNNAIIYVAWGSHCDSTTLKGKTGTFLYDGWVAAFKYDYTLNTFSLLSSFTDEPLATGRAGIWMAGSAPAIDDTTGNVYLVTGNGSFSTTTNPKRFGNSILQLQGSTLSVAGAYTPNKWSTLNNGGSVTLPPPASPTNVTLPNDQDLGSSGAALLKPAGQTINSTGFEVLGAGKEGVAYVLDPTLMSNGLSGADSNDPCSTTTGVQPLQCFQSIALSIGSGNLVNDGSGARVPPVFWGGDASKNVIENFLYTAGSQDTELRYWQMNAAPNNNGTFKTTIYATGKPPAHGGGFSFPYPGGGALLTWDDTVSNPNQNDAILWVVDSSGYSNGTSNGSAAILLAYPAFVTQNTQNNLAITSDSSNGPIANKFTVPVVVNGEVYVGGQGSSCTVGTNCGMLARWSE